MNRFSTWLIALCLALPPAALADDALVVTSWGGAYTKSQKAAYFDAFGKATGTSIQLKEYNGGIDVLKGSAEPVFDVLDMTEPDALAACSKGLLEPLDATMLDDKEDFLSGSFHECGVVHLVYSTVLAYNDRAFPGEKPQTVADFFDIKRFPGKRALRRQPIALLEWSLLAQGVPISQLYDLLSTERGMTLAFRKLEQIRDHIIWWESGNQAPELLQAGKAVMASGFNGRFFDARVNAGAAITIIWDGQLLDSSVWAIAKNSPRREQAEQFIRFATRPQNMATLASHIPYGPTRRSAMRRIGLHATSNVPMLHHMPTSKANLRRAIRMDSIWYARTKALRQRRFDAWLSKTAGD